MQRNKKMSEFIYGHVNTYPDIFENASFLSVSKRSASTRGAFSKLYPRPYKIPMFDTEIEMGHLKFRYSITVFDIWTSIKENRQTNCPRVIPKDPSACSDCNKSTLWRQSFRKAPFLSVHTIAWKQLFKKDELKELPEISACPQRILGDNVSLTKYMSSYLKFLSQLGKCSTNIILNWDIIEFAFLSIKQFEPTLYGVLYQLRYTKWHWTHKIIGCRSIPVPDLHT